MGRKYEVDGDDLISPCTSSPASRAETTDEVQEGEEGWRKRRSGTVFLDCAQTTE
jgi:hypothetical protein